MPFIFRGFSGYTDQPIKEMKCGAKSFTTLNKTKGYGYRVMGPTVTQNTPWQEKTMTEEWENLWKCGSFSMCFSWQSLHCK